ncbi:nijmegen breakage syndrome 1 protein isoform X2 [Benincasa hispida]|uniref:nijmegen breakage syndrome 1 protein isoform X2 n=1 Tax=Benincasa hispida TaxID=102211 RepID=UPI0019021A45|nr:nijmegen breakage syndrome 1 protein isoform X2 [Benincasa hispida]
MVWGFFPVDPLSGEEEFYIFAPGKYKVGRKGCDLPITKDKGVSRIHAEIVVDTMIFLNSHKSCLSNVSSKVKIRDCSKYGTFVRRNSGLKEKIHELPRKEASLYDGDMVSFGSGNATYRFSFVQLLFYVIHSESFQVQLLRDKVSSIGACTSHDIQECTHVLVEELMPFNEALVDAIVAEKPFVLTSWVELFAGRTSCNEIPSFDSYHPTMAVEGMHVKVMDPNTRKNCLSGYTFLLGSAHMYKYGDRLKKLLQQVGGANVLSIEDFSSDSQDLSNGENDRVVFVMSGGSAEKLDSSYKIDSYYKITEVALISSVLSGRLDRDNLIHPCEPGSSTCSTDETVVAESDLEAETSKPVVSNVQGPDEYVSKSEEYLSRAEVSIDNAATGSAGDHETFKNSYSGVEMRKDKVDESDNRNIDIIFSQNLIVQNAMKPYSIVTAENSGITNFKRFRKTQTHSGNSFYDLVPFDKYPYKDNGDGREDIAESLKEERRRKETEAIAEDLFHNEKGRRRGMAGSLKELFTRS